jgi:molybdopterin converting factor small subunit
MKNKPLDSTVSEPIRVVVKYMVNLREKTGLKLEEVDLLAELNRRYDFSLPDGSTMIVVNGIGWKQLPEGLEQGIASGDRISLFPPIMGG